MRNATLRFIVDLNVGRLTTWLRAMGFDTVFAGHAADGELVERALREGRIIVTKDRRLLERRLITQGVLQAVAITADHLEDQLRELGRHVHLEGYRSDFTRCLECNVLLEPVERRQVRDLVPPYVFETQSTFSRCPSCGRVYWAGTHWHHMRGLLENVANGR